MDIEQKGAHRPASCASKAISSRSAADSARVTERRIDPWRQVRLSRNGETGGKSTKGLPMLDHSSSFQLKGVAAGFLFRHFSALPKRTGGKRSSHRGR